MFDSFFFSSPRRFCKLPKYPNNLNVSFILISVSISAWLFCTHYIKILLSGLRKDQSLPVGFSPVFRWFSVCEVQLRFMVTQAKIHADFYIFLKGK